MEARLGARGAWQRSGTRERLARATNVSRLPVSDFED
jgi:hypothetical protein